MGYRWHQMDPETINTQCPTCRRKWHKGEVESSPCKYPKLTRDLATCGQCGGSNKRARSGFDRIRDPMEARRGWSAGLLKSRPRFNWQQDCQLRPRTVRPGNPGARSRLTKHAPGNAPSARRYKRGNEKRNPAPKTGWWRWTSVRP